jgi:hypothetical protein
MAALGPGAWCVYAGDRWLSAEDAIADVRRGRGVVGVQGRGVELLEPFRERFWIGFVSEVARQALVDGSWIITYAVSGVREVQA